MRIQEAKSIEQATQVPKKQANEIMKEVPRNLGCYALVTIKALSLEQALVIAREIGIEMAKGLSLGNLGNRYSNLAKKRNH
ncbi:MAG: hypothetical protein IPO36_03615 [Anaerolineales bacterium]|nr:hypothetical protein [Anaerolineales bacterium]